MTSSSMLIPLIPSDSPLPSQDVSLSLCLQIDTLMLSVLLAGNRCALPQSIPAGAPGSPLIAPDLHVTSHPTPRPHTSSPVTWYLILGVSAVGTGLIWFPRSLPTPHPEGGQELSKEKCREVSQLTQKGDRKEAERKCASGCLIQCHLALVPQEAVVLAAPTPEGYFLADCPRDPVWQK